MTPEQIAEERELRSLMGQRLKVCLENAGTLLAYANAAANWSDWCRINAPELLGASRLSVHYANDDVLVKLRLLRAVAERAYRVEHERDHTIEELMRCDDRLQAAIAKAKEAEAQAASAKEYQYGQRARADHAERQRDKSIRVLRYIHEMGGPCPICKQPECTPECDLNQALEENINPSGAEVATIIEQFSFEREGSGIVLTLAGVPFQTFPVEASTYDHLCGALLRYATGIYRAETPGKGKTDPLTRGADWWLPADLQRLVFDKVAEVVP